MFNLLTASLAAIDVDCTTVTVEVIGVGVDSGKETDHKVGEVSKLKPFSSQSLLSTSFVELSNCTFVDFLQTHSGVCGRVVKLKHPPPKPHHICCD